MRNFSSHVLSVFGVHTTAAIAFRKWFFLLNWGEEAGKVWICAIPSGISGALGGWGERELVTLEIFGLAHWKPCDLSQMAVYRSVQGSEGTKGLLKIRIALSKAQETGLDCRQSEGALKCSKERKRKFSRELFSHTDGQNWSWTLRKRFAERVCWFLKNFIRFLAVRKSLFVVFQFS